MQMLPHKQVRLLGKTVKKAMRLRGGGSALPGLVVEKLDHDFLPRALKSLPQGVVVVSGTNGKTTTTKMVVQLLRSQGLRVFTNPSGSNFTRGIVASLLDHVDKHGVLNADIAVIELDEAHAVHFVKQVKPRYSLILNVLRDQLDRFGEIDHTTQLLKKVVNSTTRGVVLNADDSLVRSLAEGLDKQVTVQYFGLSQQLKDQFPSDADLHGGTEKRNAPAPSHRGDVSLDSIDGRTAHFRFGPKLQEGVGLKIDGLYNVVNAAAALALVRLILSATAAQSQQILEEIAHVRPAFGRGEAIQIDGAPLEIVLVKNPSGFRLALSSYAESPAMTMIAINDNYADGRDMSWLWDVDFASLAPRVACVSGIRAYDMAVRLQYDQVEVGAVDTDIAISLKNFIHQSQGPRRIYCTYTAMLAIRRELAKKYKLEAIE